MDEFYKPGAPPVVLTVTHAGGAEPPKSLVTTQAPAPGAPANFGRPAQRTPPPAATPRVVDMKAAPVAGTAVEGAATGVELRVAAWESAVAAQGQILREMIGYIGLLLPAQTMPVVADPSSPTLLPQGEKGEGAAADPHPAAAPPPSPAEAGEGIETAAADPHPAAAPPPSPAEAGEGIETAATVSAA